MYQHKLARPLACGVGVTMEVIGGKWKPCLLDNIRHGCRRPSDLHRSNPAATPRALDQQLKELEQHGVVRKVIHPVLPPKAEYFLTPLGESLLAVVDAMQVWGDAHGDEVRAFIAAGPRAAPTGAATTA